MVKTTVPHVRPFLCGWVVAFLVLSHFVMTSPASAQQQTTDDNTIGGVAVMAGQIMSLAGIDPDLAIQSIVVPDAANVLLPPGWVWVQGVNVYGSTPGQGDFSGLQASIGANGALDFVVISDSGYWLSGHWDWQSSDQAGSFVLSSPLGIVTRPGARPRESQDNPEAIAIDQDGSILVGFEGDHRVQRHTNAINPPDVLAVPTALRSAFRNRGIETLVVLPNGRYLALSEGINRDEGLRGWVFDANDLEWPTLVYPKEIEDGFPWRPTAAAVVDDRLLVVERWWDGGLGIRTRLVQLPVDGIEPGVRLDPQIIFELTPLVGAFGNVEGLTAVQDGDRWIILLVTDNQEIGLLPSVFLALAYDNSGPLS